MFKMKKRSILIFLVSVVYCFAYSQNNFTFNNKYSSFNTLFSVVEHNDFLYIEDYSNGKNILRIHMSGNLVNSLSIPYEESPFTFPYNTAYITTNNFLVSAGYVADSNNIRKGIIRRIYYNLDSMLVKTFDAALLSSSALNNMFDDIKETPEGGFIVSGRYSETVTPNVYHPYLMKLSSSIDIQWIKKLDLVKYNLSTICNIELTSDMGMLLITTRNGGTVIKTTALGNILWEKDMPRDSLYIAYGNPLKYDDSTYLFSCPYLYEYIPGSPHSGTIKEGFFVMKINYYTGDIKWDTTYTPFYTLEGRWNLKIHNANNGGFAISTTASLNRLINVNTYPYIMDQGVVIDYNKYGDSIGVKQYYSSEELTNPYSWLTDMIILPNGRRIGVGRASGKPSGDAWVFVTDENGVLSNNSSISNKEDNSVQIFPNPAIDRINLRFDKKLSIDSEIHVYNLLGQVVLTDIIPKNSGSFQIDLNSMQSGVFVYEIQQGGLTINTGKFIVNNAK